jgi:hypothetical protein
LLAGVVFFPLSSFFLVAVALVLCWVVGCLRLGDDVVVGCELQPPNCPKRFSARSSARGSSESDPQTHIGCIIDADASLGHRCRAVDCSGDRRSGCERRSSSLPGSTGYSTEWAQYARCIHSHKARHDGCPGQRWDSARRRHSGVCRGSPAIGEHGWVETSINYRIALGPISIGQRRGEANITQYD